MDLPMHFSCFIFYIPLLLPFTHAGFGIYNISSQQSFWISPIIVLAAIGTIFAIYYHRENYRKFVGDDSPKKRDTTTGSLIVLAGIYAIVASFAITASLEGFFKALTSTNATIRDPSQLFSLLGSNYDYFATTFLVLTFFSVAIPSYLGTAFFLSYVSERPKDEIKDDLRKLVRRQIKKPEPAGRSENAVETLIAGTRGLFFTFVLSFLQGIFLLFMAISINSPDTLPTPQIFSFFVLWLFLLEIIDTIWIMVTFLIRTSGFKEHFKVPPPYEWVLLNTLMMVYLLTYLVYPVSVTWNIYLVLLIVFAARTLVDFRVAPAGATHLLMVII